MLKTIDLLPCCRSWADVRNELSTGSSTPMFHLFLAIGSMASWKGVLVQPSWSLLNICGAKHLTTAFRLMQYSWTSPRPSIAWTTRYCCINCVTLESQGRCWHGVMTTYQIVSQGLRLMAIVQIGWISHLVCRRVHFGPPIFCYFPQWPAWGGQCREYSGTVSRWLQGIQSDTLSNDQLMFQGDLERLCTWSQRNRMDFNVKKCKLMRITLKKQPFISKLTLNGSSWRKLTNFATLAY